MRVASFVAAWCAIAIAHPAHARGDTPHTDTTNAPDLVERGATALAEGRYAEARDLFAAAYQIDPLPKLLFALGQCEFNLNHFQGALDYYQRFLDTNPDPREAALAQQAIGAARARLDAPPPRVIEKDAPRPTYERDWDAWSTSLVAVGGAAVITGAVVAWHGYQVGHDQSATTATLYQQRLDRAKRWQWIGAGVGAVGVLVASAALVRFAVHRVEVLPIAPGPSPGALGLALEQRW